ncbi:hypothetical protein [Sphingobium nicotianae]|nr:hypothetical protein [Sphingobium nicotianae]
MDKLADRLITAARARQTDPVACRALMTEFERRYACHRAEEEAFLIEDRTNPARSIFDRELMSFREEFTMLTESWEAYLDYWRPAQIAADRNSYIGETADLMTAFKLRIALENQLLCPLVLETGRVGLN